MAKLDTLFPHSGPATTLGKISREFDKLQKQIEDNDNKQESASSDTGKTSTQTNAQAK